MLTAVSKWLEWLLEWTTIFLMISLTVVVTVAVCFRLAGHSLSWYDEVAAVQLSWVTYYGAALAALKRRHIGFDSVLIALPKNLRLAGLVVGEAIVIGFFALMAWAGIEVLQVLEGMTLISLTWIPIQVTQSVIPIGAILFIICELVSLPFYWRMTSQGISLEHAEIEEEVEHELKQAAKGH
jgi:TRAP-type C4-dicarboxylate transport system permease small subunit